MKTAKFKCTSSVGSNSANNSGSDSHQINSQGYNQIPFDLFEQTQNNGFVQKTIWTTQEDEILTSTVQLYDAQGWAKIAEFIPGRTAKQCHNRWYDCLNPTIRKGNWTSEEDKIILDGYAEIGSKWTKIASNLENRGALDVKNRYYSLETNNNKRNRIQEIDPFQSSSRKRKAQGNVDTSHVQKIATPANSSGSTNIDDRISIASKSDSDLSTLFSLSANPKFTFTAPISMTSSHSHNQAHHQQHFHKFTTSADVATKPQKSSEAKLVRDKNIVAEAASANPSMCLHGINGHGNLPYHLQSSSVYNMYLNVPPLNLHNIDVLANLNNQFNGVNRGHFPALIHSSGSCSSTHPLIYDSLSPTLASSLASSLDAVNGFDLFHSNIPFATAGYSFNATAPADSVDQLAQLAITSGLYNFQGGNADSYLSVVNALSGNQTPIRSGNAVNANCHSVNFSDIVNNSQTQCSSQMLNNFSIDASDCVDINGQQTFCVLDSNTGRLLVSMPGFPYMYYDDSHPDYHTMKSMFKF